jgi:bifunctional enzyme CysN/CysC
VTDGYKLSANDALDACLMALQAVKCIWFTGLSGAGKSTLAILLAKRLKAYGKPTFILDGDEVRKSISCDLGFSDADRVENIRRVVIAARMMADAGVIVLVSLISPYRRERQMARELFKAGELIEVFVNTPIAECERRDVKGLYAKARQGQIKHFTGIDSVYEVPENPEVILTTTNQSPEQSVDCVLKALT